ncbi:hypothetical protein CON42_10645 [Bacillus thuringiensis]|nr:hypothetical protein CON42_10645 [Bacillus thuringiensis]PEB75328.1 hypothetical protein COM89_09755 [Bacillus thuringiensis]
MRHSFEYLFVQEKSYPFKRIWITLESFRFLTKKTYKLIGAQLFINKIEFNCRFNTYFLFYSI